MAEKSAPRSFSDDKHRRGEWRSHDRAAANPLRRALWSYISLKRAGVDRLARGCGPGSLVIDCGAGSGAYSRWFLERTPCTVVSVDWSVEALRMIQPPPRGRLLRVCADAAMLPFRHQVADALFTIDTLGHVADQEGALDEMLRVVKGGAALFIHSECGDPRRRWPDRMLIRRSGRDYLAELDGHISVRRSEEIRAMLTRRFRVLSFVSPAGLLGWILGYPEKYREAFAASGCRSLALLTGMFAVIKRAPFIGALLRFVNAVTNRMELFFGISGGGSCFADAVKIDTPRAGSGGSP